ncbi:MAG TPA: alpha/beta fold hydrolase [Candidatus Sulfotelmatobacter sp.]|nr:alpha/beta fold hydrolase [Candidatus Sulfotelmatobacter sp.]
MTISRRARLLLPILAAAGWLVGSSGAALAQAPGSPARAPVAVSAACSPDAFDGAECGYVAVPLDRAHPARGVIQIHYELYHHTKPGPAQSAIVWAEGGPGESSIESRGQATYVFGDDLDVHDLLLIDQRGRGQSGAIDCPGFQHGTSTVAREVAECAAQLGATASLYGSGDVAMDIDAVRAALGYDKIDYYGHSYGGLDITAYALRYGSHLRSIVLDSAVGPSMLNPVTTDAARVKADLDLVTLICQRSPTCAAAHPHPAAELSWLADRLRAHSVSGVAPDSTGTLVPVTVSEGSFLVYILDDSQPFTHFVNTGEILAAASALRAGDAAPLLRLGAEFAYDFNSDSGDAASFSAGAWLATICDDAQVPWDWSASVAVRQAQYAAAMAALPAAALAPFSTAAVTGPQLFDTTQICVGWQRPSTPAPVVPAGARYPDVPVLGLAGDLDNTIPLAQTRYDIGRFPESRFVTIPEVGHETVYHGGCGQALAAAFVETLDIDASCARSIDQIQAAVAAFPLTAAGAPAATAVPGNAASSRERRVATVAVSTALDAIRRSLFYAGSGAGLRGGTFATSYNDDGSWTITLAGAQSTTDVVISGVVTWGGDNSVVADLTVSGRGTAGGSLHISGAYIVAPPVRSFSVTGALGGQPLAVTVPEG